MDNVKGSAALNVGYSCKQRELVKGWRAIWSEAVGTTDSAAPFGVVTLASSGSEGIPLLTGLQAPKDQVQADVLVDVVTDAGSSSLDEFDFAQKELAAKLDQLERRQADIEAQKVVFTELQAADVSKALHSMSATTGPEDGPGTHDVLFNNKLGVVVPPGVVNKILERIKPIFKYDRSGGLYTANVKLSSFSRPCQQK